MTKAPEHSALTVIHRIADLKCRHRVLLGYPPDRLIITILNNKSGYDRT